MELTFQVVAGVSTLIFLFQLLALFFAGDADFDFDFDADGDVDFDLDDADGAFKFLSLKGIVSFFMGLGWGGLLTLQQGHTIPTAILRGCLYGLLYMGLSAVIYYFINRLKQENKVNYKDAIGQKAYVSLKIPAGGKRAGEVKVIVNGATINLDAFTNENNDIPTGSTAEVIAVSGNKLIVKS